MSLRAFKQYLELLKYSGLTSIVSPFEKININIIKPKFQSDDEDYQVDVPAQIICPVNSAVEAGTKSDEIGLQKIREKLLNCNRCILAKSRLKLVYGEGHQSARIMLIGEGPGAEENISGRPFIGEAGKLLTKMLQAININREQVYITNVVKCRPPGNRNPNPDEISQCMPFLFQQIRIIKPQVILLLGKVATISLLHENKNMDQYRNEQPFEFEGIPVWITYHPSALLRNPDLKKLAWVDLQKFRDFVIDKKIV
ncbi:MAG TPA: uracil-DNA glycosylase [Candidatus Cloacimonadota bacterium]|mgnify:CR=1 FL=1|nr:uracil-DNA glycosylase [Candidatus Cloacimonadota bacterium]HPM01961.1 uracil-DNA glycosylase [Candidatus Cloacimonadota bacterium]